MVDVDEAPPLSTGHDPTHVQSRLFRCTFESDCTKDPRVSKIVELATILFMHHTKRDMVMKENEQKNADAAVAK